MKKKLTRILAIALTALMIIPAIAALAARAEEIKNTHLEESVNLCDSKTTAKTNIAADPEEGFEGLWNYFPRQAERDPLLRQHGNNTFVSSDFIPVNGGESLFIGALNREDYLSKPTKTSEHHVITLYDADFKQLSTFKFLEAELQLIEDIGYGYGIYHYYVPKYDPNLGTPVAYVKIDVHAGIYNDGDILVTKNQLFTGKQLREALDIAELSDEAKAHPFYGKKALFIGDSISYGSYDTPPTYRNPSASWARRLALSTGLIPTNISYPGASVGKTGREGVKWEYELLKNELLSKRTYDIIVFHGGVNDARQSVAVGEALSSDTEYRTLVKQDRVATFAGGLQLMFHDAREKWPEAELYYVANFKLVPGSVMNRDMNEYFAQAKILCAEYGVHYIDLYDNLELYEAFDYESKEVLPDLIHPISIAYDTLFPTVLHLFNETLLEDNNTPDNNNQTNTPNNGDSNHNHQQEYGPNIGAIIAIAVGATVVVATGVFALYWFGIKKKKFSDIIAIFKKK